MALSAVLALLLSAAGQVPPQEEKKPAPPAPQEEKKPAPDKPEEKIPVPEAPADEPWLMDFHADLRVGGWRTGTFDAMTPVGRRKIESTLLFDAGLDLRAMYSGWSLSLTADYASGKSMTLQAGGILVGMEFTLAPEPEPLNLQVAVGPLLGRLDVDVAGFGDFKSAVGFEARVAATSWIHERIGITLWVDYRQISFKYDDPVASGDQSMGGPSFAIGAGLVMRF